MKSTEFIKKFRRGERLFGTLITSPSPKFIEVASDSIDTVFIDLEHFPMDWNQLRWMCSTCRALDLPTIVRIPRPDPFEACRILDTGASGIVAAYIETTEQVQQLRGAVKLRPFKGKMLDEMLSGTKKIDGDMESYIRSFNYGQILLINIESVPAVESLDDLLSVPDVDGILIGPHDLSCSLGVPEQYDHPLFEKTIRKIIDKVRNKNIGIGIHNLPKIELDIKYAKAGINLILRLADIALFRNALYEDLMKIREGLGEDITSGEQRDIII